MSSRIIGFWFLAGFTFGIATSRVLVNMGVDMITGGGILLGVLCLALIVVYPRQAKDTTP